MDSLISAAARALAAGDPLGALKRVALRDDAAGAGAARHRHGAARRSRARAKALLRRAARAFGPRRRWRARAASSPRPRSRSSRATSAGRSKALDAAQATLAAHGDVVNAAHARPLAARRLLLIGHLDEAEQALAGSISTPLPAGVAGRPRARRRRHRAAPPAHQPAREALARAGRAARDAGIPALTAEVERALPRARDAGGAPHRARRRAPAPARACRSAPGLRRRSSSMPAAMSCATPARWSRSRRRPVLFALARALAEAWPGDVARDALLTRAFRAQARRRIAPRAAARRDRPAAHGAAARWPASAPRSDGFALVPRRAQRRPRSGAPRSTTSMPRVLALARRRRSVVDFGAGAGARTPASAPCSARSTRWRRRARCSRSVAGARVAG